MELRVQMLDDDAPTPTPPTRAFDRDLAQRVARGMGGVWEARQIEGLLTWFDRYERVLTHIAVYGTGESAVLAGRVLAGDDVSDALA